MSSMQMSWLLTMQMSWLLTLQMNMFISLVSLFCEMSPCRAAPIAFQTDSDFNAEEVKKHMNDRRKELLCKQCIEKGCILKDVRMYTCRLCKRELGRAKFAKPDIDDFQRGSVQSMKCTECKFSAAISR